MVEQKNKNEEEDEQKIESEGWAIFRADGVEIQLNLKQIMETEEGENHEDNSVDGDAEQYLIGKS